MKNKIVIWVLAALALIITIACVALFVIENRYAQSLKNDNSQKITPGQPVLSEPAVSAEDKNVNQEAKPSDIGADKTSTVNDQTSEPNPQDI